MPDGDQSSYGSKSVTTSAQLIAGARSRRDAVLIQNVHASQVLYLGPDSSVVAGSAGTASSGIRVAAGESIIVPTRGDVYGIASGASTDVRYWEIF